MSGYTKGPWQLNGFYVDQDAATRVATVSNWRMSGEAAYSEAKANARLIAAAPDLLEALETCLLIVEHLVKDYAPDTISAARAAIAKARGAK